MPSSQIEGFGWDSPVTKMVQNPGKGDWHPGLGGEFPTFGVRIQLKRLDSGLLKVVGKWLHYGTHGDSRRQIGYIHGILVAYTQPIGRFFTAYIPGIVLAFVWGLCNPCNLLPEPE